MSTFTLLPITHLPPIKSASLYTPLEWVQMLAVFYQYQGQWPKSVDTNHWDDRTKQSQRELNFKLPPRAVVTCFFEEYDNLINLAQTYLSGKDISDHPLMRPFVDVNLVATWGLDVPLTQVVELFIRFHTKYGHYPRCGPSTWSQNTLRRCVEDGLVLPSFVLMKKLGGMKAINAAAEAERAYRAERKFAAQAGTTLHVITPTVVPTLVTPEAEQAHVALEASFLPAVVLPATLPSISTVQQLGEAIQVNSQLQEVNDQASKAIDDLRERLKKAQAQVETLKTEKQDLQARLDVFAQATTPAPLSLANLPLAVRHLLDPFTRQTLARFDGDPDMKYVGMIFERATRACGLES